ncbi:MAG TPA: hypothetical protein VNX70_02735 [Bryobacteraceae bacterium]|nr:hypothetical protein [Bryobacteraceae bacterium]
MTDKTIFIPGHGKLKKQGKSFAETIAAKPTAAYDAKWGQFLMTHVIFTKLVYSGVQFGTRIIPSMPLPVE